MVVIRRKSDGKYYTHRWARSERKPEERGLWTDDLSYARHFFRSCDAKQCNFYYYPKRWGSVIDPNEYEIVPVRLELA